MESSDYYGFTDEERKTLYKACRERKDTYDLVNRLGGNVFDLSRFCVVGREMNACSPPSRCVEDAIGKLVGVRQGCVLFVPEALGSSYHDILLGILRRRDNGTIVLDPLSPGWKMCCAGLTVHTPDQTNPPAHTAKFRAIGAEAWLYWQIGSGHCGSYQYLLFTPSRWSEMKEWLDYWLPKDKRETCGHVFATGRF